MLPSEAQRRSAGEQDLKPGLTKPGARALPMTQRSCQMEELKAWKKMHPRSCWGHQAFPSTLLPFSLSPAVYLCPLVLGMDSFLRLVLTLVTH